MNTGQAMWLEQSTGAELPGEAPRARVRPAQRGAEHTRSADARALAPRRCPAPGCRRRWRSPASCQHLRNARATSCRGASIWRPAADDEHLECVDGNGAREMLQATLRVWREGMECWNARRRSPRGRGADGQSRWRRRRRSTAAATAGARSRGAQWPRRPPGARVPRERGARARRRCDARRSSPPSLTRGRCGWPWAPAWPQGQSPRR